MPKKRSLAVAASEVSSNKTGFDVKEAPRLHGPALAKELVDIALNCKNPATRVLALRECFDRMLGQATQPAHRGSRPTVPVG